MMKMNHFCAALCAGILAVTGTAVLPAAYAVHAEEQAVSGVCGENASWNYDTETCTLTISGSGKMTDFGGSSRIPWAAYRSEIRTVTVADGITSICSCAFFQCTALTSVTLPDSITEIGDSAFHYCRALTSLRIPENLTEIGRETFAACHSLEKIDLPAGIQTVARDALSPCGSLTAINVDAANPYYSSQDGVLFSKDMTRLIQYPAGKTDLTYTIPETVTEIEDYAFYMVEKLEQVTVPAGITVIPEYCFSSCESLNSVTLPDTLTRIESTGFYHCTKLTRISLPESLTYIGSLSFARCTKLAEVTIPASAAYIGGEAFYETAWIDAQREKNPVVIINGVLLDAQKDSGESFTVPDSVHMISGYAFKMRRDLKKIVIPDSVRIVGEWAFEECDALEQVTFPASVEEIGNGAVQQCPALKSITIENKACKIANSPATVSTGVSEETGYYYFAGTVYGYRNSTAQVYADRWDYRFEPLDQEVTGDLSGDGEISAEDAQITLKAYVNTLAGKPDGLTDAQRKAADVDGSGTVDAIDAQFILKYYVETLAGKEPTWEALIRKNG